MTNLSKEVERFPFLYLSMCSMGERQFWQLAQFTSIQHSCLHALSLVLFHSNKAVEAAEIAGCLKSQVTRAKKTIKGVIDRFKILELKSFELEQLNQSEIQGLCVALKRNFQSKAMQGLMLSMFDEFDQTTAASVVGCKKQNISNCKIELAKRLDELNDLRLIVSPVPIKEIGKFDHFTDTSCNKVASL
jgi:hypothetical protein